MGGDAKPGLDYSRALYDEVVDWYKNADGKAQILLALLGVFIGFFTSSVFAKADDLGKIVNCFTPLIWFVLAAMAMTVTCAVLFGLACLWSRIPMRGYIFRKSGAELAGESNGPPISAREAGFFGIIWTLHKGRFQARLQELTSEAEVEIRTEQIHVLSRNVFKKHLLVDFGFFFGGASLLMFLFAGVLYIHNVSKGICWSPSLKSAASLK